VNAGGGGGGSAPGGMQALARWQGLLPDLASAAVWAIQEQQHQQQQQEQQQQTADADATVGSEVEALAHGT